MWRKWTPFLVVLVMRARFFFSPMTTDEGGYLAVARAWFRGADLYGKVWVDRPQGLLVVYGILDRIGLGNTFGIRFLAFAACCLAMVACGHIAWTLVGEPARMPTIWATGIALSIAQIEGFIANAELLSCAVGALGCAAILLACWSRGAPDPRLLFVGGLIAGCAVTLKQSGFDATVAACVGVIVAAVHEKWKFRDFTKAVGVIGAGVAVPVGLVLVHASLTGFHDWWYAVAGVRIEHASALASADWPKLRETGRIVAPIVAVALVCAVPLFVRMARTHVRAVIVLSVWSIAAIGAFLMGGLFHRHYWVILMFPFATVVGTAFSGIRTKAVVAAVAAASLVVPFVETARAVRMGDNEVAAELDDDTRIVLNEHVADWFARHDPGHGTVWAMCASSALYALIDQAPPFRYSWFAYFAATPEALPMLYDWLGSDARPEYVVQVQSARRCDPSGQLGSLIGAKYSVVDTVMGHPILKLAGS
ncbi:MAG: hypothetical protein RLZZ544_847 [Actinomycetota bacterium]|jgi:hypothetical protein